MGWNLNEASKANKTNNKQKSFEAIPEGRYIVQVDTATVVSTSTGKTAIDVAFSIIDVEYTNRKGWTKFVLTEAALPFIARFLSACNSNIIEEDDASAEDMASAMVGKVVSGFTQPGKTTNGNPKNDWRNWEPVEIGESPDNAELFQ